jgi:hypothetical protein
MSETQFKEQLLTNKQMHELIDQIKDVKDNSQKLLIMKERYYSFCPQVYTNNNHLFIHALYNSMEVLHERPTVSKDDMLNMLEKKNVNGNFDFNVIKQIFNDF